MESKERGNTACANERFYTMQFERAACGDERNAAASSLHVHRCKPSFPTSMRYSFSDCKWIATEIV
jgi:hypothetical protein